MGGEYQACGPSFARGPALLIRAPGGEGAFQASCFPSAVAAATGETPSDILVVKNGAKVQSSKLTVPFWGYPLDPLCRARAVGTH